MTWTKPDFQEITLNMEVTGYVNTQEDDDKPDESPAASEMNLLIREEGHANLQSHV